MTTLIATSDRTRVPLTLDSNAENKAALEAAKVSVAAANPPDSGNSAEDWVAYLRGLATAAREALEALTVRTEDIRLGGSTTTRSLASADDLRVGATQGNRDAVLSEARRFRYFGVTHVVPAADDDWWLFVAYNPATVDLAEWTVLIESSAHGRQTWAGDHFVVPVTQNLEGFPAGWVCRLYSPAASSTEEVSVHVAHGGTMTAERRVVGATWTGGLSDGLVTVDMLAPEVVARLNPAPSDD
ncbi:MAG: hypothetical protein OXF62_17750 [Caldilineaceae bacterium]|nr:hypothetical protein [Caldilineaceae bacterium]